MTPAHAASPFWYDMLPRLGATGDFAAVRGMFEQCGYTGEGVLRRLQVERLHEFKTPAEVLLLMPVEDLLDALIRVFTHGLTLDEARLNRFAPAGGIAACEALGLLERDIARPQMRYSPVAVLASQGTWTACDRWCAPDGVQVSTPQDAIYPAVFPNTLSFVSRLPRTRCEAMLDLGTGTGIAAIVSSPHAERVWATDITPRAAHFAEFNRRLAGLENVTVMEGDLYEPVAGLTFDRIAIHPPYVPARQPKYIYREGGEDGEQITRRVIERLPEFLRPGGRFYAMLMAADREDEMFDRRVRKWLGESEGEFDVVSVADAMRNPDEHLAFGIAQKAADPALVPFLLDLWSKTKTRFVFYGSLLIHRHAQARPAISVRTNAGRGFEGRHMEWLLEWETAIRKPGASEMLLSCRPAVSPDCELRTLYRLHEGRFVPREIKLEVPGPFQTEVKCMDWLALTVAECDGRRTWREIFEGMVAAGRIGAGAKVEEFAQILSLLVSGGVLQVTI
jgi:methylase of polypeptide subunit release factors